MVICNKFWGWTHGASEDSSAQKFVLQVEMQEMQQMEQIWNTETCIALSGRKRKVSSNPQTDVYITAKPAKAPSITSEKETPAAEEGTGSEMKKKMLLPSTEEEFEIKKKWVLEGGAAADGIKVCNICNVVINSQKVFEYHIAGQKHAKMLKKQAEAAAAN